jgi:cysteine desulfurase
MLADLKGPPLNPSSIHSYGQKAKILLLQARETVSSFFGVKPSEIIFTSGGTESLNLLIRGFYKKHKSAILSSPIEHSCVYKTLLDLEKEGAKVTFTPIGMDGDVKIEDVEKCLTPEIKILVFSAVNPETGIKLDLDKLAKLALEKNLFLLVDGVALLGKEKFSIPKGVSAMGFASHKIHGPKGVGCIYLRSTVSLSPQMTGGPQEYEKRAGTQNLSGIFGFAEAIKILQEKQDGFISKMEKLRVLFEKQLKEKLLGICDVIIHGNGPKISNTTNIAFLGVDAESLLISLDREGVYTSFGSACSSGAVEPSRILMSMGISREIVKSSLRFSLGRQTTKEEIERAVEIIVKTVKKLKELGK